MLTNNPDTEAALERAKLALFETLGWETANAYCDDLDRAHRGEVILHDRLETALHRLNPPLPAETFVQEDQRAVAEGLSGEELAVFDILTWPRPALSAQEKRAVKQVARSVATGSSTESTKTMHRVTDSLQADSLQALLARYMVREIKPLAR